MPEPMSDARLAEIRAREAATHKTYSTDVFYLEDSPYFVDGWTWCPVIDGDPDDLVFKLPRFDTEEAARVAAQEWLNGELAKVEAEGPSDVSVLLARIDELMAGPDPDEPHVVALTHGGQHWDVTHPAACDRLPYGQACALDELIDLENTGQPSDATHGTYEVRPVIDPERGPVSADWTPTNETGN